MTGRSYSVGAGAISLRVNAKPGARQDSVLGVRGTELLVSVRAPAEKGKANDGIVRVLAAALGVGRTVIVLKTGGSSRHKVFEVPLAAAAALAELEKKT